MSYCSNKDDTIANILINFPWFLLNQVLELEKSFIFWRNLHERIETFTRKPAFPGINIQ